MDMAKDARAGSERRRGKVRHEADPGHRSTRFHGKYGSPCAILMGFRGSDWVR